jgi:hypothetical protein
MVPGRYHLHHSPELIQYMSLSQFYYSGWPSENSDYDCHTQEGKRHFLKDMEKYEGIKLTAEEIQHNDALRSEAKLAMNSYVFSH